ncbi:MAG: hypothetical protein MUC69_00160 [Gemmatimonadales bacterium]|nr:hypothetical protein [Gemmatimonadales bacterium]
MTATLVLLDPTDARAWAPFLGSRPVGELRAGVWRIRERWEGATGLETSAHVSAPCAGFAELDSPPAREGGVVRGPAVVARADFAPIGTRVDLAAGVRRLTCRDTTVAWCVPEGASWSGPDEDGPAQPVDGLLLGGAYDLVTALERFLHDDCSDFTLSDGDPLPAQTVVLGDPSLVRLFGATVEPGVVFDVRHGAVVVERGAEVRHGSRLEGPCYVGAGSRVQGGFVRESVIGPRCNVRGEISSSCFTGYANKAHDGFVGHSVLGHWVNLGAGTTTSNLKNTYGAIRLLGRGTPLETGRQFLGSLIGDHAKTAIGTMLATGTVVGAGANLFGGVPPREVPAMAWGHDGERLTAEGFVRIAERVMPRRDVAVTPERRAWLLAMHQRLAR